MRLTICTYFDEYLTKKTGLLQHMIHACYRNIRAEAKIIKFFIKGMHGVDGYQ